MPNFAGVSMKKRRNTIMNKVINFFEKKINEKKIMIASCIESEHFLIANEDLQEVLEYKEMLKILSNLAVKYE